MQFFLCAVCNVLCIVWSPDELARMASVLCAEVCVKCLAYRVQLVQFRLFGHFALPDSVLCAKTAEVCQEFFGTVQCTVLCMMCVVWSLLCNVCSVNMQAVLCSAMQLVTGAVYIVFAV